MAITNGRTPTPKATPKATSTPKGVMYQVPPKPRTTGGISGSGGSNVSQDYKETGIISKIKKILNEAGSYPEYKPTVKQELQNKKNLQILKLELPDNLAIKDFYDQIDHLINNY